jgi:translocation and assembly module TamB
VGPQLTGNLVAEVPQGRVRLVMGSARSEELDFSRTRLTLDAGPKALGARLALPLKGLGQVSGSVDLPGWRLDDPARPGQPLTGGLKANLTGLARIANLVPDLTGVTGSFNADLTLGGTLGQPGVKGQASLRGFGAEVPLIGLSIANLNLNLLAPTMDRLDIQGQGQVGGGRLELSGDARLGPAGLSGRLLAAGERLKVANTKEYMAFVSPRIQVDLTPQGARVSGEITVPQARIRPRAIPAGTVSPSPDVVLVDEARERQPPFPVDIDLRLLLGDDVTIDAFGVRGRLIGDLRVTQAPGRQMLGDGQLAIVDGIYRFSAGFGFAAELGAPLTIAQGRLVYAKSPIGNPGLLLQAQREGGDTSAGVRVLGNIRKPQLAFFSDSNPNMSQAEITKYLLTGIPPHSDGGPADQSVSVGTYVAPKLYMEYESGIGDRKDAVKLRYDWSRHIELQTETGDNAGADIFYKFEK